jgi:hypothetical protein
LNFGSHHLSLCLLRDGLHLRATAKQQVEANLGQSLTLAILIYCNHNHI